MTFRDRCELYFDKYGLFKHNIESECDGNPLVYYGSYAIILSESDLITYNDREKARNAIESCFVRGFPGILNRHPDKKDQETHDNYVGAMSVCSSFGLYDIAKIIFCAGKDGMWDNLSPLNPNPNTYFMRFSTFRVLKKIGAEENITLFDRFYLKIAIIYDAILGSSESDKIILWQTIKCINKLGFSGLFSNEVSLWKRFLFKKYKNGMADVFRIYFYKNHPFVEAMIKLGGF